MAWESIITPYARLSNNVFSGTRFSFYQTVPDINYLRCLSMMSIDLFSKVYRTLRRNIRRLLETMRSCFKFLVLQPGIIRVSRLYEHTINNVCCTWNRNPLM